MPLRASSRPRSVLMIGSEAIPFSKTGGLADVLGALPQALGRLGWETTLVIPRYRDGAAGTEVARVTTNIGGYHASYTLLETRIAERVRVIHVDEPTLFDRGQLYSENGQDYPDNARRFALLARAALDFAAGWSTPPSIVHAHDWQAGLAPVYLETQYAGQSPLSGVASVFTIHNLAYQGLFEPDWLPRLDLPWSLLGLEALEYWGKISFLKGGINYAHAITTVSRTYAKEIQTEDWGFGFDGILRRRSDDLFGILNGIDTEQWDPARDPHLPQPFDGADLSGKRAAKSLVLTRYGLPADEAALSRPLIGMISRMVDQKGLDLIAAVQDQLPRLGATFVILGTGDARYQDMWRRLAKEFPELIGVQVGFDEALAHQIEAGADLFMMPSRFEPCGLNQMYSLRYGTVPIVRRVGGLADTVTDFSPGRLKSTGFVFDEYTPHAFLGTLKRALTVFSDRARWRALQSAGMAEDHSWDRSAQEYVKIYERAITTRGAFAAKGDRNGSG
jgi:starch synthase